MMRRGLWQDLLRRLRRIAAIARVESLYVIRDRATVSLIVVVPAVQLALFGYAVNPDPKNIPIAIARDATTDAVVDLVERTGYFRIAADRLAAGQAARMVEDGRVLVGIELPTPSFDEKDEGRSFTPKVVVDATDPATVRPAMGALETALWRHIASTGRSEPPLPEIMWLHNPERRTAWSIVPALAGVVSMIGMLMMGAMTLVRERESGTWEALLATPADAVDALFGKLAPYVVIGMLQTLIVLLAGALLFDVPFPAAVLWLMAGAALFAGAHLIAGFAISALARTQIQAVQGAVFFYLPSMLLSGFMFPFQGMPAWAQAIGNALPLTHFVRATRDVLLKGKGAEVVAAGMAPIGIFTLFAAAVALVAFRRRL